MTTDQHPQTALANEAAITVLRASDFQALACTLPIPFLASDSKLSPSS